MSKVIRNKYLYKGLIGVGIMVVAFFVLPLFIPAVTVDNDAKNLVKNTATTTPIIPIIAPKVIAHEKTPTAVKGIYMTACVAGTPSFRAKLLKLANETEINSIVIDIKDYSGTISFDTESPKFKDNAGGGCKARDMEEFIKTLHDNHIYVIGRITAFQDPYLARLHPEWSVKKNSDRSVNWKDHKGIGYVDAGNREVWKYLVDLAKESYAIGFDEINFDYIRFPSDGDMKDIYFPASAAILKEYATSTTLVTGKSIVLKNFYEYLHENLKNTGMITSADLFGMTATNFDDLNIGQVLENAAPNFDYISPMVYPSHYPIGFNGYKDVNAHPYDIVNFSMNKAVARLDALATATGQATSTERLKLRPWLQDNNYPVTYTAAMVRAQIQATYDAGLTSWMLWDAGNKYTQSALKTE